MQPYCHECDAFLGDCTCGQSEWVSDGDEVYCPYCFHMHHACDSDGTLYDEHTTSYHCGECGEEFAVSVSCNYSWTTRKLEDNGDEN